MAVIAQVLRLIWKICYFNKNIYTWKVQNDSTIKNLARKRRQARSQFLKFFNCRTVRILFPVRTKSQSWSGWPPRNKRLFGNHGATCVLRSLLIRIKFGYAFQDARDTSHLTHIPPLSCPKWFPKVHFLYPTCSAHSIPSTRCYWRLSAFDSVVEAKRKWCSTLEKKALHGQ